MSDYKDRIDAVLSRVGGKDKNYDYTSAYKDRIDAVLKRIEDEPNAKASNEEDGYMHTINMVRGLASHLKQNAKPKEDDIPHLSEDTHMARDTQRRMLRVAPDDERGKELRNKVDTWNAEAVPQAIERLSIGEARVNPRIRPESPRVQRDYDVQNGRGERMATEIAREQKARETSLENLYDYSSAQAKEITRKYANDTNPDMPESERSELERYLTKQIYTTAFENNIDESGRYWATAYELSTGKNYKEFEKEETANARDRQKEIKKELEAILAELEQKKEESHNNAGQSRGFFSSVENDYKTPYGTEYEIAEDALDHVNDLLTGTFVSGLKAEYNFTSMASFGRGRTYENEAINESLGKLYSGESLNEYDEYVIKIKQLEAEADMLQDFRSQHGDVVHDKWLWGHVNANELGKGIGTTLEKAPEFAAAMYGTRGLGSFQTLSVKTALKAGQKDLIQYGINTIGKNYALAKARGFAAAPFMSSTYGEYFKSLNSGYSFDENGGIHYKPVDKTQAYLGAVISNANEISSEYIGVGFSEALGWGARSVGNMVANSKVGGAIVNGVRKVTPNLTPQAKTAMLTFGVQADPVAETLGEAWGDIMTTFEGGLIGKEVNLGEYFTMDYWTTLSGVSILYGGTMAAMGAVKSYHDVNKAVKEREGILGEVVNRNLYNTLVAISTSDDVVLASSALADFDWKGNYDNAQDMKAEMERARAYVVADLNVKVMEGVVSETSRLESFRGTIEGVRNIVYQDKAGKYSDIIREAEMDGKKVYIINGYEANTNQYIVVDATTGENTSVDKSKVKPTRELDVDTYIVGSYKNEFSLETEKQRVADVKAKALQLDNPTEKDVARIASTLGITLPKVGNVVMLANGNMGAVTEVLSPTEYAVQDPSGTTYKVHFTDILSTDKLTATAQGALARGEVAAPIASAPQTETTPDTISPDENGITIGAEVTVDGRVGKVRARTQDGKYAVAFEAENGNYEDTEMEFFTGEELASLMGIAPAPTAEAPEATETAPAEMATTEDGSVDIEQMSAEDAAKVLVQRAGTIEEAIAQVKQVIETVAEERKKTAKAEKKASLNDIGKKSAELQALDTRLEFYGEVLAALEGMLAEQQKQTMTEAQNVAEEAGVAPEAVEQPTSGLIRNGAEMKFTDNVIKMVDFVAKRLGITVEFVNGLKNEAGQPINGDITGKRVRISTSGTKGVKFIMGHEFFHRMKDLVDEQTYADFVNSIKEYAGEKLWNATIAHQRNVYRNHNTRVVKEAMAKMSIDDVAKIAARLNVNIEGLSLENAKDAVIDGAVMGKEKGIAEVNAIFPKMLSYDDVLMVEESAADVAGALVTNTKTFAKYVEDNSSNIPLVRGLRKAIRAMRDFFDSFGYTDQQRKLNALEQSLAGALKEAVAKEAKGIPSPVSSPSTTASNVTPQGVEPTQTENVPVEYADLGKSETVPIYNDGIVDTEAYTDALELARHLNEEWAGDREGAIGRLEFKLNAAEIAAHNARVYANGEDVSAEDKAKYQQEAAEYDRQAKVYEEALAYLKKPATEGKTRNSLPSLVGVHNISLDKLRKVIKMGGLANPSVAVIDVDKQTHDDYGDYSLVLPKNMVDSRQGKNAGTWAGDAWTPTYPQVIKRMNDDKAISRFYKDIDALPEAMRNRVRLDFDSFMDGRDVGSLAYWYLYEKGVNPALVTVPSRYSDEVINALSEATNGTFNLYNLTPEALAKCLEVYIKAEHNGDKAAYEAKIQERKERLMEKDEVKVPDRVRKWAQDKVSELNEYGFDYGEVLNFVRDVESDVRKRGTVDVEATIRTAKDQIKAEKLDADYDAWLENLDVRYGIKEYIFNGYTNNGDRKYLPHTVENASKWMKKQGREGAVSTFPSFGVFIANAIPKMTTLESIRKRKALLGKSNEEFEAFNDKWLKVYHELGNKLQPDAKGFDDYGYWRLIEAVGHNNPKEFIKKEYGIELSEEDMAKFNDMVNAIRTEYPARYFETKFERPLQLSDFTAAVVPNDIPLDVESRLKDAGVEVIEYEKGDNASRAEAMQKASEMENVRFSIIGEVGASALDMAEEATIRMDNLAVAREMETSGKDAKAIRMATGWERGADGLWRYEIMDAEVNLYDGNEAAIRKQIEVVEEKEKDFMQQSKADTKELRERTNSYLTEMREKYGVAEGEETDAMTEEEIAHLQSLTGKEIAFEDYKERRRNELYNRRMALEAQLAYVIVKNTDAPAMILTSRLGHVLKGEYAEQLFKAYPSLKDMEFRFVTDIQQRAFAAYAKDGGKAYIELNVKKTPENMVAPYLMHEVQHAIQDVEGFAEGGSPAFLNKKLSDRLNAVTKELEKLRAEGKTEEADALVKLNKGLAEAVINNDTDDYGNYQKLMGEVEARNVSSRINMSAEERLNTLLSETEDVAREDQIFLREGAEMAGGTYFEDSKRIGGDATTRGTSGNIDESANQELTTLYSLITPEMDADYLSAVERGDMTTAQQMVMEAAERAGYTIRAYHGTPNKVYNPDWQDAVAEIVTILFPNEGEINMDAEYGTDEYRKAWDLAAEIRYNYREYREKLPKTLQRRFERGITKPFTVFDTEKMGSSTGARDANNGFFFSPNPLFASSFRATFAKDPLTGVMSKTSSGDGVLYDVFIKPNNLLDLRSLPATKSKAKQMGNTDGYDVVINKVKDGRNRNKVEEEIMVKDPTLIKSADPVTYDDAGNVIPLSERFNPEKEDIRYSLIGEQGASALDAYEEATTRLDNLNVAREMEAQGKDALAIKQATGWERGKDGLWRYEVADYVNMFDFTGNVDYMRRHPEYKRYKELLRKRNVGMMFFKNGLTKEEQKEFDDLAIVYGNGVRPHNSHKLKDYLDSEELFAAYPQLRDINVEMKKELEDGYYGRYIPSRNTIELATRTHEYMARTLFHEVQHAIQHIEGFANGGNTEIADPRKVRERKEAMEGLQRKIDMHERTLGRFEAELSDLNDSMEKWWKSHPEAMSREDFDSEMQALSEVYDEQLKKAEREQNKLRETQKEYKELVESSATLGYEGYERLAGEVEARATARRVGMSEEERRNTLQLNDEDVARKDQIILRNGLFENYAEMPIRYHLPDPDPSDVFFDEIPIFDEQGNEVDITTLSSEEAKEILDGKVLQMLEAEYDHNVSEIRREAREARAAVNEAYREAKIKRRKGEKAARTNAARIDEIFGDTPFESLPYEVQALILIATGEAKIYWGDKGNKRGLASELGLKGSTGDRHAYRNIWGGAKKSFDEVVHSWWKSIGGYESGVDTNDLRNALISALQSVQSSRDAMQEIINKYDDLAEDRDNTLTEIDRNEEKELYEAKSAYEQYLANFELSEGEERTAYYDRAAQFFGNQSLSRVEDILEDLTGEIERNKRKIERLKAENKDVYGTLAEGLQKSKDIVIHALERLRMFAGMEEVDLNDVARLINLVKTARSRRQMNNLSAQATALVQRVSIKKAKTNLMRLLSLKLSNTDIIHKMLKETDTWTKEEREAVLKHLWKVSRNGLRVSKAVHKDTKEIVDALAEQVKAFKKETKNMKGADLAAKIQSKLAELEKELHPEVVYDGEGNVQDNANLPTDFNAENKRLSKLNFKSYLEMAAKEAAYHEASATLREKINNGENTAEANANVVVTRKNYLDALTKFNSDLENLIVEGKDKLRDWNVQKEKHEIEIRSMGIRAIGGKKASGQGKASSKMARARAIINTTVNAPYWTFETVLEKIDHNSPYKKGKLYTYFMDKWADANDDLINRYAAHMEEIAGVMRKCFPDDAKNILKLKRNPYALYQYIMRKAESTPIGTLTYKEMGENGKMRDAQIVLNVANAMYVIAMWRQPRYQEAMQEKHGITQSDIDALMTNIASVNAGFLDFMDWVNDTFLPSTRLEYDVVYRKMNGGSMPKEINYFPARVAGHKEVDLANIDNGALPTTPSALKDRMSAHIMPQLGMDYFKVLESHIQDMDNWAAYAELTADLNVLLSSDEFRRRCNDYMGGLGGDGGGKGSLYDLFKQTSLIATGMYRGDAGMEALLGQLQKAWATSNIAFRGWTAVKQISSITTGMFDNWAFYKHASIVATGIGIYHEIKNAMEISPSLRYRWKSGAAGMEALARETQREDGYTVQRGAYEKGKDFIGDAIKTLVRAGMTPNAAVDLLACSIIVNSVYETEIARLTGGKREATEEEKRAAVRKAERAFNTTQQSSEGAYLAPVQANPAYGVLTTYMNASFALHRKRMGGIKELWKLATSKKYRRYLKDEFGVDAAKISAKDAFKDILSGVAGELSFAMMGWGLMKVMTVINGWLNEDDDDEDVAAAKQEFFDSWWQSLLNGYLGGSVVSSWINGFDTSLTPAYDEFAKDVYRLTDDKGSVLWELGMMFTKYRIGIDLESLYKSAAAIENMYEDDERAGAVLMFLNAPDRYVKAFVGDRREGETLEEYTTRVGRTYALLEEIKFDEKGKPVGGGVYENFVPKSRYNGLDKVFEEEYREDMLKKYGGDKGYADYTMADLKHKQICGLLDWNPNATPSEEKVQTDMQDELEYYQKRVAKAIRKRKDWVGDDEGYYDLLMDEQEAKNDLINNYYEYIKQAGLGAY